ncbi:YmdB family metallophosphoesterase, partial [Candidatus Peregrinibacteria bacterium]|nr:YmdB family metallophosphoesterase [Candidatus Peregrinibacteria bacterium]
GTKKVAVISLIGRVFMHGHFDDPLRIADKILKEISDEKPAAVFVDFHAEATSEKHALAFYLDGRVSAVVGTHTHVQTNDARIFDGGTAFISDVGMTGPLNSMIGLKKGPIVEQFLTQLPGRHDPETEGKMEFSAVIVEVDDQTGKALNIKSILEFIN